MATYDSAQPRKPASTLTIPVTAFSDDWLERPTAAIAVGLRLLSELDGQIVTRDASNATVVFFGLDQPGAIRPPAEVMNAIYISRCMALAVARSVCDPNDVQKMHDELLALEDHVHRYFSPDGIKFVFQALQEKTAALSPLSPEASDEELTLLVAHLKAGTIASLPFGEQLAIRRLLGCALEPLRVRAPGLIADDESEEEDPDEDEEVVDYDLRMSP